MADKKISALTASTTPLAGTEVLPIVQSGSTVKVAVSDLTAGRPISATQLTLSTGNLIIGTADKGIDFSANPSAPGMISELLNDYETGTWTPVVADAATGGNVAGGTYSGTYTKIGRNVFVTYALDGITTAGMTAGNDLYVRSLPFAANSTGSTLNYGSVDVRIVTITAPPISFLSSSFTYFRFTMPASASGFVGLKVLAINSGNSAIFGSFSYQTN